MTWTSCVSTPVHIENEAVASREGDMQEVHTRPDRLVLKECEQPREQPRE